MILVSSIGWNSTAKYHLLQSGLGRSTKAFFIFCICLTKLLVFIRINKLSQILIVLGLEWIFNVWRLHIFILMNESAGFLISKWWKWYLSYHDIHFFFYLCHVILFLLYWHFFVVILQLNFWRSQIFFCKLFLWFFLINTHVLIFVLPS